MLAAPMGGVWEPESAPPAADEEPVDDVCAVDPVDPVEAVDAVDAVDAVVDAVDAFDAVDAVVEEDAPLLPLLLAVPEALFPELLHAVPRIAKGIAGTKAKTRRWFIGRSPSAEWGVRTHECRRTGPSGACQLVANGSGTQRRLTGYRAPINFFIFESGRPRLARCVGPRRSPPRDPGGVSEVGRAGDGQLRGGSRCLAQRPNLLREAMLASPNQLRGGPRCHLPISRLWEAS